MACGDVVPITDPFLGDQKTDLHPHSFIGLQLTQLRRDFIENTGDLELVAVRILGNIGAIQGERSIGYIFI